MDDYTNRFMAAVPVLEYLALNLLAAILILVLGWMGSIFAGRAVRRLVMRSRHIDPTVIPMAQTVTVWVVRVFVIVAVLARFGVQTTSIIATLGAIGLAIGLALQNTLQNVAAGIMLLILRPLRAGESVSIVGKADGTVEEIGLFLTRLVQSDGTYITLPNSMIWGNPVINFSRNTARRMDVEARVRYGDDLELALLKLRELVQEHAQVLDQPAPQVMVTEHRDSAIIVNLRVWARVNDYWSVRFDLQRRIPEVLQRAGLNLPIPISEVQARSVPATEGDEGA